MSGEPASDTLLTRLGTIICAAVGFIAGVSVCAVFGIRHEIADGETDLIEIFQWGVMPCAIFGGAPGAFVGAIIGQIIDWYRHR